MLRIYLTNALLLALSILLFLFSGTASSQATDSSRAYTIGSKNFNENYILGEIISQLLEDSGFTVDRNFGMSGTMVIYEALRTGEVDAYVEYSGTLAEVIFPGEGDSTLAELNQHLQSEGIEALQSFGFNNTYALAMKRDHAADLGVETVSELAAQENIDLGFSVEFLNRADGWLGLIENYGFTQQAIGMDHGLAYQAIDAGTIDATDAYSTDGDLELFDLIILRDDLNFFPQYYAVPLIHQNLDPQVKNILRQLEGRIDEERMRDLNGRVMLVGKSFAEVASEFLTEEKLFTQTTSAVTGSSVWSNIYQNTLVHLQLTIIALSLGCLVGLPLGVIIYRSKKLSRGMLYVAGLMQTIPSLALLALFIPIFGIGRTSAIIALFLYSLLPILRSTITALLTIDPILKRAAEAIGMTRFQQLRFVLVPLALPNVLSGVKTAAIISIGTATLAAFIGAGGLGEPIVTGLALNNTDLILQGAIPAACLAIITEMLFDALERTLVKPHMLVGQLPS